MIDVEKEVLRADMRIRDYIRQTPLDFSPCLSGTGGSEVFLKLENFQYTGSFKVRGAMNKLLSLTPEQKIQGCVTASTGNHGAAVAFGLQALPDVKGIIFVPENAEETKVAAIQRLGGEVRFHGRDAAVTETYAHQYADAHGMVYISPYNDPQIIGGQGTIGVELLRQLAHVDTVFVALGGGGLISGVAGYLKAVRPQITVIGCSPQNSAVMAESVKVGRILDLESKPTLSDGTAGGLEAGAITFELCRELVDDYVQVSEDEIIAAMRRFIEGHHMMLEGAAGVAIAGYLKLASHVQDKRVAIVVCGANMSLSALKSVLS